MPDKAAGLGNGDRLGRLASGDRLAGPDKAHKPARQEYSQQIFQ